MVRKCCAPGLLFPCRTVNLEIIGGKRQSSKAVSLKTLSGELIIVSHSQFCIANDM